MASKVDVTDRGWKWQSGGDMFRIDHRGSGPVVLLAAAARGNVPGRDLEGVSGLEYLFVVSAVEREAPLDTYPQWGHEHLSSGSPLNGGVASMCRRMVRNCMVVSPKSSRRSSTGP